MAMHRLLFAVAFIPLLLSCNAQPTANITVTDDKQIFVHTADGNSLYVDGDDVAEPLFQTLYDMCEYYNTCDDSVHVPSHVKPFLDCCVPCDCSGDCMALGNCCRDKVKAATRTSKMLGAEPMVDNREVCYMVRPAAYLIVNHCHPDFEMGHEWDMCEIPFDMSLTFLTPVYSPQTNLTYSNIHCARCNYQTHPDIVPWGIKATCDRYVPVHDLESVELNFLRDGCFMSWIPEIHSKQCYKRATAGQCRDELFASLCMNVKGGASFVNDLRHKACSTSECGLSPYSICGPDTHERPTYQVFINWVATSRAVGNIVDNVVETRPATCPVGETFVEDENTCLHVTCCPSQVTISTEEINCVDPVTEARGLCLDTRLRVTIATDVISASIQELEATALAETRKLFPTDDANSPFLSLAGGATVMRSYSYTPYIVYDMRMIELMLDFSSVSTRYRQFESRLLNATPPAGVSVAAGTAGLSYSPQALVEVGFLSYSDNLSHAACEKMVAMVDMQFCKMVMFAPGEYAILKGEEGGDVLVLGDGREFESHEYALRKPSGEEELPRYAQVCLETFLSRRSGANSGNVVTVTMWLVIWASLVCGLILGRIM